MLTEVLDLILDQVLVACRNHYGERLVSLVVFGSVGRGTPRPDSDLDLLVVAEGLPDGRIPRVEDFAAVESEVRSHLAGARARGFHIELSPVFKTPAEVKIGSPLFLDMTEDARILHDAGGFMRQSLADLKARLERLGSRRTWRGNAWYWDLKPDYKPGDVFEI